MTLCFHKDMNSQRRHSGKKSNRDEQNVKKQEHENRNFPKSWEENCGKGHDQISRDRLRCCRSRAVRLSDREVKRESFWRIVEASRKIVQTHTQLLPDLGHPRQFAFVFLKIPKEKKKRSIRDQISHSLNDWHFKFIQQKFVEINRCKELT